MQGRRAGHLQHCAILTHLYIGRDREREREREENNDVRAGDV